MEDITVSVLIVTYQHAKYIAKTLDSVLIQKTKYRYEIIVVDDGSTDGTRELLLEYRARNADKIRLLMHPKNTGKPTQNAYMSIKLAKGRYIALMDGDDFWIDEYKLEKQIDYLEARPDCMGVFGKSKVVNERGYRTGMDHFSLYGSKERYELKDFEESKLPGHASSFVCRNIFYDSNGRYNFYYKLHPFIGDMTLYCMLLTKGYFGFIDEEMSVKRMVAKKKGTNYSSIMMVKNYCYIDWRYFCNLECCVNRRMDANINLNIKRKQVIMRARNRAKVSKRLSDFYIYIKVIVMDSVWKLYKVSKIFS